MNRDEALELLKAGDVDEWNRRRKSGETCADLSRANLAGAELSGANFRNAHLAGADLSGADLSGANFRNAHLAGTELSGADLSDANFSDADLSDANLSNANLHGASLNNANLYSADLIGADLNGADLWYTNLSNANLSDANLSGARCGETVFAFVDLSNVKKLEAIVHHRSSAIGVHTLYESRGKIPDVFLRGCGVPEDLIAYLPSLVGAAIEFYSCFISHSSKNEEFAQRLYSRMQQEKLRVWFAPEDMRGGRKSIVQIDEAIRVHDKLLLVLSKHSMESEWVKTEIRRARKAELRDGRQKLFPIRLCSYKAIQEWECFDSDTGEDLAAAVREYHIPDFSKWKDHDAFEAEFTDLLRDLRASEK